MQSMVEGIGALGAFVAGPPWILGWRGAPRSAPENTLVSLRAALELGLDGVHYELRAAHSGELVLLADETLDRTTDGHGRLAQRDWIGLAHLDAGGHFARRFLGEPLPLFEEVLELSGNQAGSLPQHVVEILDRDALDECLRTLRGQGERLSLRLATTSLSVARRAQEQGASVMFLADRPDRRLLELARDERWAAVGLAPGAWSASAGGGDWPCERWELCVERPEHLLAACRRPIHAFTTSEPARALAVRALCRLAPHDRGPYPLSVPLLSITPTSDGAISAWVGEWNVRAQLRNPFGFRVRAVLALAVARGVFESEGLPQSFALAPGAEREVEFRLRGGARSPGSDPRLLAELAWAAGPGRPSERLIFDAPLERVRTLELGEATERLPMLIERPGEPPASVIARRRGRSLLLAIENAGGMNEPELVAHLDGLHVTGRKSLRLALPTDFGQRAEGVAFSVGIRGRRDGQACLRRWAGGVPHGFDSGACGRLTFARA